MIKHQEALERFNLWTHKKILEAVCDSKIKYSSLGYKSLTEREVFDLVVNAFIENAHCPHFEDPCPVNVRVKGGSSGSMEFYPTSLSLSKKIKDEILVFSKTLDPYVIFDRQPLNISGIKNLINILSLHIEQAWPSDSVKFNHTAYVYSVYNPVTLKYNLGLRDQIEKIYAKEMNQRIADAFCLEKGQLTKCFALLHGYNS